MNTSSAFEADQAVFEGSSSFNELVSTLIGDASWDNSGEADGGDSAMLVADPSSRVSWVVGAGSSSLEQEVGANLVDSSEEGALVGVGPLETVGDGDAAVVASGPGSAGCDVLDAVDALLTGRVG